MKAFACLVALFAVFAAFLPALDAQVAKDDPKNADEKKVDDKKAEPKKKAPGKVDEATVLSAVKLQFKVKEVRMTDDDSKEIVVLGRDEKKYVEFLQWDLKFKKQMSNTISVETQKKLNPQQQEEMYRRESTRHLDGVFSLDPKTVAVTNNVRIRTMIVPQQIDEKTGKDRKLTATELNKLKGGSRLPGYPVADFSGLRAGQVVDLYVPRSALAPPPKQAAPPPAKKGFIGADPTLVTGNTNVPRMEAYLILIVQE